MIAIQRDPRFVSIVNTASAPVVKIVGRNREAILSLDDWFAYAPPAGGAKQWVDGYSAKEQAKAWIRDGGPALPAEILAALQDAGADELEYLTAYPEHETRLDNFGRGGKGNRNHDVLAVARRATGKMVVIGIEAKACENFDGIVAERAIAPAPSNKPHRANLLSRALFGRDVCDVNTRTVLDAHLAAHGYQLWTAAVGTLIEAAKHGAEAAILVVHQFALETSGERSAGDRRDWAKALLDNDYALASFVAALTTTGEAPSHATEFVPEGISLRVLKARAPLPPPVKTVDREHDAAAN